MIAVDVGNSRIKFGLFLDDQEQSSPELPICSDFLAVRLDDPVFPWDELERWVQHAFESTYTPPKIVATSVNALGLRRLLDEWPVAWPKPRLVNNTELPIRNRTRYPEKVGTDRLVKAIAANVLRPAGSPIVIVDSGTATTVDWVTEQGEFAGGAILPGIDLCSRALSVYTDQLPLVTLENLNSAPEAIGDETTSAIRSGLFWGQVGAIRELIERMSTETSQSPHSVLVTGGGGRFIANYLKAAEYRPTLALEGLVISQRREHR